MTRYATRWPLLLALGILLSIVSCGSGESEDIGKEPELLEDTFQIIDNPAEAGDAIDFVVGFTDQDGDMPDGGAALRLVDQDGYESQIDLEELALGDGIEIRGTTKGILRFSLIALEEYDGGEFFLTAIDGSGRRSDEISAFLDVNPPSE